MKLLAVLLPLALVLPLAPLGGALTGGVVARADSLPPLAAQATDLGVAAPGTPVSVVVGLELRNRADMDALIQRLADPASPDFQKFLTQDEINERYGPTQAQADRVVQWLSDAGFQNVVAAPNRLLVTADGTNANVVSAFGVPLHDVLLGGERHVSIVQAPLLPTDVSVFTTGVLGLDDLTRLHPMHATPTPAPAPHDSVAGNCCAFSPVDLATFYNDPNTYTGSSQTIVIAGAYAWKDSDNTAFNSGFGIASLPSGSGQVCAAASGAACVFDASNSIEVALDVEYAHGTAPAAVIKNYMTKTTAISDFTTMYNKIVTDDPGHSVTTSWGLCEVLTGSGVVATDDSIFASGAAKGQSWFAASGDSGAYDCGALGVPGAPGVDYPASSSYIMGVGGTTASCSSGMTTSSPKCGGYGSELAWAQGGGGVSAYSLRPSWQTGCGIPVTQSHRLVPDVALEADPNFYGNLVYFNGGWNYVGGTSDASPQWAGYFAEINQKKGGTGLGLPGVRLYGLCGTTAFHDVTVGSNGVYPATSGYDMATGLGTINAANMIATY
ncbi:MAG: pseudomonalisin [Thermoplasmata archaeon]|jgi:subtilase family serine protease|nr:pseudomonalisin [Thermoplasmata archaeon]